MRIFLRFLCVMLLCSGGGVAYGQEPAAQAPTETPTTQTEPTQVEVATPETQTVDQTLMETEQPEATTEQAADEATPAEGAESPETEAATFPAQEQQPAQPEEQATSEQLETAAEQAAAEQAQAEVVPEQAATPEAFAQEGQPPSEQPEQQEISEQEEAAPTDAAEPAQEEGAVKIEEIEGIDTVDLKEPRGNWLFKRIWWERAENKYDKIRTSVQEILEMRMKFFMQRSDIDKNVLDPFYIEVGLGKGEFQEVLDELSQKLERLREKDATLTGQERDLLNTLEKENQMLEQLTLDIKSISQLDVDIDNALAKLMEQINRVRGYERDAWRYFKEISRVLSDKKARELFYKMDVISNNIKDIKEYLDQAFTQHYEKVISTVQENVERIKTNVQSFKEKGVDFKAQAQKMIEDVASSEDSDMDDEDEEDDEDQAPQGWFGSTLSMLGGAVQTTFDMIKFVAGTVWDYTVYIIKMPYNMIFGPKEVTQDDQDVEADEQVSQETVQEEATEESQQPDVQKEVVEEQTEVTSPQAKQVPSIEKSGMFNIPGKGSLVEEPKPQIEIPTMPQAPEGQSTEIEQETQEVDVSEEPVEESDQAEVPESESTQEDVAVEQEAQEPAES